MARIIDNQTNVWGRQQGAEPQRSDLWVADFNQAINGTPGLNGGPGSPSLRSVIEKATPMTSGIAKPFIPSKFFSYYCQSVELPELRTRADEIRRDTRPYRVPWWDEPCDSLRIKFILDCYKPGSTGQSPYTSDVYQLLDVWRAVVRAGRSSMSSEYAITLDGNYRIDYAFDVKLSLLRGSTPSVMNLTAATTAANYFPGVFGQVARASVSSNLAQGLAIQNDLEISLQLILVNCWLSSFRLSELSYENTRLTLLDAVFYLEDIKQPTTAQL